MRRWTGHTGTCQEFKGRQAQIKDRRQQPLRLGPHPRGRIHRLVCTGKAPDRLLRLAGLRPGLLRLRVLRQHARGQAGHAGLDEQLGLRQQHPHHPWRSAMALPREVELTQTPDGPRLTQKRRQASGQTRPQRQATATRRAARIPAGTHPLPAVGLRSGPAGRRHLRARHGRQIGHHSAWRRDTHPPSSATTPQPARSSLTARKSGTTAFHPPSLPSGTRPRRTGQERQHDHCGSTSTAPQWRSSPRAACGPSPTRSSPTPGADKMALFAEGGTAQLKSLTVTPLEKAMFK